MIDRALVTGGGSGIGRAVALRLAELGIPLLLIGRPASTEQTRLLVLARGGQAEVFHCDLGDYAAWSPALAAVIAKLGGQKWGAVLAASMLDPTLSQDPLAGHELVFRTNVLGNLASLQACLPVMTRNSFGRAIFFGGGGAAYAYPQFPAYALSKVSTVRLVENLAATHLPKAGFSFVCLAPGAVDTPMLAKVIAAGGEVKTKTSIDEPVGFAEYYFHSPSTALSGRFVHVRDDWKSCLDGGRTLRPEEFFLRRVQ